MPGFYFEEFTVGQVFKHTIRRTVTETDNVLFSAMTHNPAPLHIDKEYMRNVSEFGEPLMNSFFTLGLIVGISINDITLGTTVANLGLEETTFPESALRRRYGPRRDRGHCEAPESIAAE